MNSLLPLWRTPSWNGEGRRKLSSEEWKGSLRWQDKSHAVGWGGEGQNIGLSSATQPSPLLARLLQNGAFTPFSAPSLHRSPAIL